MEITASKLISSTRLARSARLALAGFLGLALTACATPRNPISDWQATDDLRTQAETGDPASQYRLGMHYTNGRGVFRNDSTAFGWFSRAADAGHADAQFMLATAYATGRGVDPDPVRAVSWYHKAAKSGQHRAQSRLGDAYLHGQDVTRDRMWGARWTGMAAEQGHVDAQVRLAALYSRGLGVPQSWFTAATWLGRAERGGHQQAARGLENARQKLTKRRYEEALARAERWNPTPGLAGHDNRPTLVYIQHALNRLGFTAGYADGIQGPKTRAAIDRFRQAQGLTGSNNLDAIVRELRTRTPDLE